MIDDSKLNKYASLDSPWMEKAHPDHDPCFCWHIGPRLTYEYEIDSCLQGKSVTTSAELGRFMLAYHPNGWQLWDRLLRQRLGGLWDIPLKDAAVRAEELLWFAGWSCEELGISVGP